MSRHSRRSDEIELAEDLPLAVSRAPLLTLWASIVAERLGHQRDTALTLGKAVAGTTARLKVRTIGRDGWVGKHDDLGPTLGLELPRTQKAPVTAQVLLLGKTIRLLPDASGELRAALRTLPTRDGGTADEYVAADPVEVERYLVKAFGLRLEHVRTAMERLAARCEAAYLNRIGLGLFEKFQPGQRFSREGKRTKTVLEVGRILAVLPNGGNPDEPSKGSPRRSRGRSLV